MSAINHRRTTLLWPGRRGWALLLLTHLLFGMGCQDEVSALRVRIDASDEIKGRMQWLEVRVRAVSGEDLWSNRWAFDFPLPTDVSLQRGKNAKVQIEAMALNGKEEPISRAVAQAQFEDAKVSWVELNLDACPTCQAPPSNPILPPAPAPDQDAGTGAATDAGPPPDGGAAEVLHVNPGCDPVVQQQGLDAAWTRTTGNGEILYVTQGKRRWALFFTAPGDLSSANWDRDLTTSDLAALWSRTPPQDTSNPGLSEAVQENGISAAWIMERDGNEAFLVVHAGIMFFTLDLDQGTWLGGAEHTGVFHDWLTQHSEITEGCQGADAASNPGQNETIQAEGVTAISRYSNGSGFRLIGGHQLWYGAYNPQSFQYSFSCHFENEATGYQQAGPPACNATDPVNPGCDETVQNDGVDTAYWTRDGVFHVTQGIRHWGFRVEGMTQQWMPEQYVIDFPALWRERSRPDCSESISLTE